MKFAVHAQSDSYQEFNLESPGSLAEPDIRFPKRRKRAGFPEEDISGAEARVDSIAFVPGMNPGLQDEFGHIGLIPGLSSRTSFSAACSAPNWPLIQNPARVR
jgi:hypothetical protein